VFITSSHFSPEAQEWADSSARPNIVLIDGERLAELMVRFEVGVITREKFAVQEIDEDFFLEEIG
jgi:restriction system protein